LLLWWNWQTHWLQTPALRHVGSTPTESIGLDKRNRLVYN
jgi:hypothetical protein